MLTVCSLTWQEPVKYTLSTKMAFTGVQAQLSQYELKRLEEKKNKKKKPGGKTKDIQRLFYGVLVVFKTNRVKQLLQQEKSAGLGSGIISTAAGKLGRRKGK